MAYYTEEMYLADLEELKKSSPPTTALPTAEQNTSYLGDIGTGLKQSAWGAIGSTPELLDMALNISPAGPLMKAADVSPEWRTPFRTITKAIGEATDFQPTRFAEEANQEYTPEMQAKLQAQSKMYNDPEGGFLPATGMAVANPDLLGVNVAQSIPYMLQGGLYGKGMRMLGAGSRLAGAAGEGLIMGQSAMEQGLDSGADPLNAALGAGAVALGGGAIGALGGAIGRRAGLEDIDVLVTGGRNVDRATGAPLTATQQYFQDRARRTLAGGMLEYSEELGQTALETGVQNVLEGKPIGEGMGAAAAFGGAAGFGMGAGSNLLFGGPRVDTPPVTGANPTVDVVGGAPATPPGAGPAGGAVAPAPTVDFGNLSYDQVIETLATTTPEIAARVIEQSNAAEDVKEQLRQDLASHFAQQATTEDEAGFDESMAESAAAIQKSGDAAATAAANPITFAGQDVTTIEAPDGSRVVRKFLTAQGSEYVQTESGMQRRNKSYHANTGGADQGVHEWYDNAVFTSPDAQIGGQSFGLAVQRLAAKSPIVIQKKDGQLRVLVYDGGKWRQATVGDALPAGAQAGLVDGAAPLITAYSDTPTVGHDVMEWTEEGGVVKRFHPGSPVTEVFDVSGQQINSTAPATGRNAKPEVNALNVQRADELATALLSDDTSPIVATNKSGRTLLGDTKRVNELKARLENILSLSEEQDKTSRNAPYVEGSEGGTSLRNTDALVKAIRQAEELIVASGDANNELKVGTTTMLGKAIQAATGKKPSELSSKALVAAVRAAKTELQGQLATSQSGDSGRIMMGGKKPGRNATATQNLQKAFDELVNFLGGDDNAVSTMDWLIGRLKKVKIGQNGAVEATLDEDTGYTGTAEDRKKKDEKTRRNQIDTRLSHNWAAYRSNALGRIRQTQMRNETEKGGVGRQFTSALNALDHFRKHGMNAVERNLASVLYNILKNADVAIKYEKPPRKPWGANEYGRLVNDNNKLTIYLRTSSPELIFHEILHAATTQWIVAHPTHGSVLRMRKALKDMRAAFKTLNATEFNAADFGLTERQLNGVKTIISAINDAGSKNNKDIQELMTYMLTNNEFGRFLQQLESSFGDTEAKGLETDKAEMRSGFAGTMYRLWDALTKMMKSMFGDRRINGKQSVFSAVLDNAMFVMEASANTMEQQAIADADAYAQDRDDGEYDERDDYYDDYSGQDVSGQEEELDEITTVASMDKKRIRRQLGLKMYGDPAKMPAITAKELLQNAADAVRDAALTAPEGYKGRISITIDRTERTVTVQDNGKGMDADTITSAFMRVAGSKKDSANSAGGFGVAKLLFLYGGKRVQLDTVKDGIRYVMDTTGEAVENSDDEGIPIPVKRYKTDQPNGTKVVITIPEEFINSSDGATLPINMPTGTLEELTQSPLFVDAVVTYNGDELDIGSNFPFQDFTNFADVEFAWGKARIIVSKQEDKGLWYNTSFLSNGLYQFRQDIKLGNKQVPRKFYINVEPRVKPDEPGYPFEMNRQRLTEQAAEDFGKIFNYIGIMYRGSMINEVAQGYGQLAYANPNGTITDDQDLRPTVQDNTTLAINEGDDIAVVDNKLIVNGREVPTLTAKDLDQASVDLSKFKIDQDLMDTTRPMIHSNLAMEFVSDEVMDAREKAIRLRDREEEIWQEYRKIEDDDPRKQEMRARWSDASYDAGVAEKEVERLLAEQGDSTLTPVLEIGQKKFGERFNTFLYKLGNVFMELRDKIAEVNGYDGVAELPVGLSLSKESRGRLFGVHIRVPFQGMFILPASFDMRDSKRLSLAMYQTMVHEAVHTNVSGHDADFINADYRLNMELEVSGTREVATTMLQALLGTNMDIMKFLQGAHDDPTAKLIGNELRDPNAHEDSNANMGDQDVNDLQDEARAGNRVANDEKSRQRSDGRRGRPAGKAAKGGTNSKRVSGEAGLAAVRTALIDFERGKLQLTGDYGFDTFTSLWDQATEAQADYPDSSVYELYKDLGGTGVIYGRGGYNRYGVTSSGKVVPLRESFSDPNRFAEAKKMLADLDEDDLDLSGVAANPTAQMVLPSVDHAVVQAMSNVVTSKTKPAKGKLSEAFNEFVKAHPLFGKFLAGWVDNADILANFGQAVVNRLQQYSAARAGSSVIGNVVEDALRGLKPEEATAVWNALRDPTQTSTLSPDMQAMVNQLRREMNKLIATADDNGLLDKSMKGATIADVMRYVTTNKADITTSGFSASKIKRTIAARQRVRKSMEPATGDINFQGANTQDVDSLLALRYYAKPKLDADGKPEKKDGEIVFDQFVAMQPGQAVPAGATEFRMLKANNNSALFIRTKDLSEVAEGSDGKDLANYLANTIAALSKAVAGHQLIEGMLSDNNLANSPDKNKWYVFDADDSDLPKFVKEGKIPNKWVGWDGSNLHVSVREEARRSDRWVELKGAAWGKLDGKIINGSVLAALYDMHATDRIPSKTYNDVMRYWKINKTALSIPTHVTNVMSSFILAYLHDIPMSNIRAAAGIVLKAQFPAMARKAGMAPLTAQERRIWEEFQTSGAMLGNFSSNELHGRIAESLAAKVDANRVGHKNRGGAWHHIDQALQHETTKAILSGGEKFLAVTTAAYEAEDNIFRMAAYMTALKAGNSHEAAGKFAKQVMIDYQINARHINFLRQTALPFVAWPYRAAPMLARIAIEKPHKLAVVLGALYLISAIGFAAGGGDEDDTYDKLPDYMRQRVFGFGPRAYVRMPWGDAENPVFMNLGKWVPGADLASSDEFMGVPYWPTAATPSGPWVAMLMAGFGYDPFLGRELRTDTNSTWENAKASLGYLTEQVAPGQAVQMYKVGEGLLNPKTGLTGNDINNMYTISRFFGLRMYEQNMTEATARQYKQIEAMQREFTMAVNAEARAVSREKNPDWDEFNEWRSGKLELMAEKIRKIQGEE